MNLAPEVDEQELRAAFEVYGRVTSVRGYGVVLATWAFHSLRGRGGDKGDEWEGAEGVGAAGAGCSPWCWAASAIRDA